MVTISAAVEGLIDEAIAKRLIVEAGAIAGSVYGKNGKAALHERIAGYNSAAAHAPWFVLIDLDRDAGCAPNLRRDWLSTPAARLCFRIAVREIEAWLFADRERLARFLSLPLECMPSNPDAVENPKEEMVRLAAMSGSRKIREDMVPRLGSGRLVGPAYTSRLIEFVTMDENAWRPDVAEAHSDSLRRTVTCLKRLITAL